MAYLKCDRGDYRTGTFPGFNTIGDPYGLPAALVAKCVRAHEAGHAGHKVKVVKN